MPYVYTDFGISKRHVFKLMIDTVVFIFTFIVLLGAVGVICGLIVATAVKPNEYMQAALINNAVGSTKDFIGLGTVVPSEIFRWSANNIASVFLLALCIYAHITMNQNEGQFLENTNSVYKEFNDVFTYAIVTPIMAVVGVIYGATVPLINFVVIPIQESLWGAILALQECQDPLDFINALVSVPITLGKLAASVVKLFDTDGGTTSWMLNSFELTTVIRYFQVHVVQPIIENAECLCEVMSPTVVALGRIITSADVAEGIHATVNTVWRFLQVPIRFAAPQYHVLDFSPVFTELRDLGYSAGNVLDDFLQAYLTIATQSTTEILPRPSLGMAVGRLWSGAWSAVELPLSMVAAAVGHESMYKAADASNVFDNLYLSVLAAAGGANVMGELFTTGSVGTKAVLTCNSYDFDFYETHDIRYPTECVCIPGTCGMGMCSADRKSCTCRDNAVHAVPGDPRSKCVPSCLAQRSLLECNEPFDSKTVFYGICQESGQCQCTGGAKLDVRTGRCSENVPDQYQTTSSKPNCQSVQTTGPPLPCAIQSLAMGVVGFAYVFYEFTRETLLLLPARNTLWDNMKKYDGVWYSRFDSVTCEYRKNFKDDYSIHTSNCRCNVEPGDEKRLENFDPWCSQPTLNANVYNHFDALAFYAGYGFEVNGYLLFTGGMGTYSTFLSDSFGLAATTMARSIVEWTRVASHMTAGFISYASSMMSAMSGNILESSNLLQKPLNCDWGPPFDGPLKPEYASSQPEFYDNEHSKYLHLRSLCRSKNKCSATVTSAVANWPRQQSTFLRYVPETQVKLLNAMHDAYVIQEERESNTCNDRTHTWGTKKCEGHNNKAGCYCNVAYEWQENFLCSCVAFYPETDVANSDTRKSNLYQNMPWCHSMMLEWGYYRVLELSVAFQNFFARLDSSNPVSVKLDSPCYDTNNNYVLSQLHSVVKAFQPSPKTDGSFNFIGNQRTKLDNQTICKSLSAADEGKPQWINFKNGKAEFPMQGQPSLSSRLAAFQHAPAVDYAPGDLQWIEFLNKYPSPRPGFNELTDKVYRLHPQTCGYAAKGDTLLFQPCANSCRTPGGNNRCWCDVVVSNDITCNVGKLIYDTANAGVVQHRQLSTAIISVFGMIKGGMRINYAQGLCDLSRVIGSMSGAIASILTGQMGGRLVTSIRYRIATLLFTIFDTLMIMPLGSVAGNMEDQEDELEDMEGEDALHSAALATMYQNLFQDMFDGDSDSAVVDIATLAGSLVANGAVIQIKFTCIAACNALSGIQKFIYAHDASAPGSEIIPTIEDFIDVVIAVLDEVYTNFVIMAANMIAGFVGMITGGPPTIGEWLSNALDVIEKTLRMINAPKHAITFLGIIISMLPDYIRPIAVALMSTMCKGVLIPLDATLDALNSIDILGFGFNVYNPFEELVKGCVDESQLKPALHTGDGNAGYARRLLESEHWEGDTFCAHYGRANHTHDEHYHQCVRNRHTVADLRQATGRDYYPWTLMDDWKQPVLFIAQTLHGIFMYYAIGEPRMRVWKKAGYPVDASLDIIYFIKDMQFPQVGIKGLASVIPEIYPDYLSNNASTGFHMMRVLDTVNRAHFPHVRNLSWSKLYDATHSAVTETISSISLSIPDATWHTAKRTPMLSNFSRRLYSSVTVATTPTPEPTRSVQCDLDDSGVCIHCALLQKVVSSFKLVSASTATYYATTYPQQISYFTQVLSYAQRGENAEGFNFVSTRQYATTATAQFLEQQPVSNMTYQSHSLYFWPTQDDVKAFFIPKSNINDPVPFFGHSLWYYLQYPLRPCKVWNMAYHSCDAPKYSTGDSAVMTFHVAIALQLLGMLTGVHLPFTLKVPMLAMMFMIFRYDYVPRCLPVLPWCLIIDLQRLITNVLPPHLCELVPALVTSSCSPGLEESATYRSCPRNDLGFLDPFLFLLRWKLPTVFTSIFSYADWGPEISVYLNQIENNEDVTSLQTTCLYLAFFDVIIVTMAIVLAVRLAVPMAQASAKSLVSSAGSLAITVPYLLQNNYEQDVR